MGLCSLQVSDQREKNTITNENLGLDFINQLRPVKFKYNVQYNQVVYTPVPRVDGNGNPVYEQVPVLDENGEYTYDENGNQIFENGPNQIIDIVEVITPVPGTKFYHGLIAQELDTVLTNLGMTANDFVGLNKDDPDHYFISYMEFVAPLIKAIRELTTRVELLENI